MLIELWQGGGVQFGVQNQSTVQYNHPHSLYPVQYPQLINEDCKISTDLNIIYVQGIAKLKVEWRAANFPRENKADFKKPCYNF